MARLIPCAGALAGAMVAMPLMCGCATSRGAGRTAVSGGEAGPDDRSLAAALAHAACGVIAAERESNLPAAAAAYDRAGEYDPRNADLAIQAANLYLQVSRSEDALRVLRRVTDANPDAYQPWILSALIHQAANRFDPAAQCYRGALRVSPSKPHAYAGLCSLDMARGDLAAARRALDTGWRRVSERGLLVPAYESLGVAFVRSGGLREAVSCFTRVADLRPDSLGIRYLLAMTYDELGKEARAAEMRQSVVTLLEQKSEGLPEADRPYCEMADLLEQTGQTNDAVRYYEMATRQPGRTAQPFLRLAALYFPSDPARAFNVLNRGESVSTNVAAFYAFRGLLHSHNENYRKALADFERAEAIVRQDPDRRQQMQPSFYFWYGSACEREGHIERAESLFHRCLAMAPDNHEAYNYLAYMWAERGVKLGTALDYVNRALSHEPDNAAYLDTLGWILYKQGRHEEALRHVKRALKLMPDDATVAQHAGDILAALKRDGEAVAYWKLSLKLDPAGQAAAAALKARGIDPDSVRPPSPAAGRKPAPPGEGQAPR